MSNFYNHTLSALAPGKLILAGEHAVAQGAPALVMAVDYFVTTTITPATQNIEINFTSFNNTITTTQQELLQHKQIIDKKFSLFKLQQLAITEVLTKPTDLALYTLATIFGAHTDYSAQSCKITIDSTLPIGCGLGSSAATIVSLYKAFNRPFNLDELKVIESLQHGNSSGVDLTVSIHGGCHYFHAGLTQARSLPALPLFMANTGARLSSGAAICKIARSWQDNDLLPAFTQVVNQIDRALINNDAAAFAAGLSDNHHLLCQLGVVPKRVQQFISALSQQGFAANISGAGAVEGEQAGIVLITGEGDPSGICQEFGYELTAINSEAANATSL